jgi:hypothetical protein
MVMVNPVRQFIEMLKKLSLQDLGFIPEEEQALLQRGRSQSHDRR